MDRHNLSLKEKIKQRTHYLRYDFPYAYGISLGEYKCNRKCRMCPMYNMPPIGERYITDRVFEKACKEFGTRKGNLEISAYGETFLHPHADVYMFKARKLCPNAYIVIATNGTLLDEERCKKIVDSGINHLSFSLDAGSNESYKWLTGSNGFDDVCRNLERLVDVRNKRNARHLKITTHIIGIKELSSEFDDFIKRWEGIVDSVTVRNYGNWAGLVDDNGITPFKEKSVPSDRYPCVWLWFATKIEPNGDVSKCFIHVTGDKNPLGNIMNMDFGKIWKGKRLRYLRYLHEHGRYNEVEFCDKCTVWSLFPNVWYKLGWKWF